MRIRTLTLVIGLGMSLGISATAPPRTGAQEQASESSKRKVKSHVDPEWPPLARKMNVAGKVKIEATVSAEGRVTNTRVVGGSPVLVNAASDAVTKWRFEPASKETTELVEIEFTGQR
jgi:TonB family protein